MVFLPYTVRDGKLISYPLPVPALGSECTRPHSSQTHGSAAGLAWREGGEPLAGQI